MHVNFREMLVDFIHHEDTEKRNKVISNNESTKRIVHERHENHEKPHNTILSIDFFRAFRDFRGPCFFTDQILDGMFFLGNHLKLRVLRASAIAPASLQLFVVNIFY